MCIVEKRGDEGKGTICIYYAGANWNLINSFEAPHIVDIQDCKWTMHDTAILVQDGPLESQFAIYGSLTGQLIASHNPRCNMGLGIRLLSVSPNKKLTACSVFDQNLSIYNNLANSLVTELEHKSQVRSAADGN